MDAYFDIDERITDAVCLHHVYSPDVHVCVRVRLCVRALTFPRRNVRALSVGVDRVRLGSQAFGMASAFNANIGAWNTALVTSLNAV
jgi:hypothetical protein